ncbi:hypothetical protein [Synechococcus sp. PCC 6312]|uniref:hypothetical protein n=1 Tax=Synechococcus sp. (strain ATCC 27167 / PCC 6312) TaxID=195253 RepID=UPI00029EE2F5|nr:hypothetical protein [Synechococcus sp. PCC 6312]AFY59700.1 hypothetical protein Syn6312_0473 [Synechococcus sp. PCC 6312]
MGPVRWSYDLVIIGNSLAAIQGAIWAATVCRVGLVIGASGQLDVDGFILALETLPASLELSQKHLWIKGHLSRCQERYSLGTLAQAGVDVIQGNGSFEKISGSGPLNYVVGNDYLQAPAFILVDRPLSLVINQCPTSPDRLLQFLAESPPPLIHVPGQQLADLGLVRLCRQLEIPVAWGGDLRQLLPHEDPLVIAWLAVDLEKGNSQAQNCPETPLKLATTLEPVHQGLTRLNLSDLATMAGPINVNPNLQTAQPQIYACGSWLGGYDLPMITRAEVKYLIQGLIPRSQQQPLNYKTLPWWFPSPMPIARIGWHSQKAQRAFSQEIYTYPVQAEHFGLGYGQIVVNANQRLLGATLWGEGAIAAVRTLGLGIETTSAQDCLAAAGWEVAIHPRQHQAI